MYRYTMQLALHPCVLAAILAVVVFFGNVANGKKLETATEENCEVCVKFMTRFMETLDDDVKGSPEKIETAMRKTCKSTKKDDNRFCYYIGGLEESATGMLSVLSKPISWGVPADKVCMKMYRKDEQICDLKYDKVIDLSKADFNKLKVKDLKQILSEWDETCRGCTEKSDFVARINELMPKHDPKSYEARKQEL